MSKAGIGYIVLGLLLLAACIFVTITISRWYVFTAFPVSAYWIVGAYRLDRRAMRKEKLSR
ncbi:hypothetical protein LCGC14_2776370 [marine sediment metagenome]|uniref:Uncharacterized protein n=1 Tax=marine sediment metagenome TaxID=412755 RepID=A0A0F8YUK8_9ZZZZ